MSKDRPSKKEAEKVYKLAEKICKFNRELWSITGGGIAPPGLTEEEAIQWQIKMLKKYEETFTIDLRTGKPIVEKDGE